MAVTTATKPAATDAEPAGKAPDGKRRLVLLVALPLVAVLAGWYFLLGPGAGGSAAEAPEAPEPGAVVQLEPITMNLADGRLLKVGLALQLVAEPSNAHGELTGAVALDEAISYLGSHSFAQLADPGTREAVKDELSHRVSERYHSDVIEVYFTEFVMQ